MFGIGFALGGAIFLVFGILLGGLTMKNKYEEILYQERIRMMREKLEWLSDHKN